MKRDKFFMLIMQNQLISVTKPGRRSINMLLHWPMGLEATDEKSHIEYEPVKR
ncbi:hypothetical protein HMPREF0322_04535 [Desulfitobacterium hafniense DP7]|uniref:Uncharacterized protein n=1 Tax=Desulfitobacterium hafniense DP7 TaxID=537010 RepID=G9XU77_DESHA|nr:hypothetical protein HMPREF0322_04535 [Desulfitobacterium hafniense DP7]